jgi:hypothetical protein
MGLCASAPAQQPVPQTNKCSLSDPGPDKTKIEQDSIGTAAVELSLDESSKATPSAEKSPAGENKNQEKGGKSSPPAKRLSRGSKWELLRGTQHAPECKIFAKLGMALLSHESDTIFHHTVKPLTVTFSAPPRVDANAMLERETAKGAWEVIKEGAQIKHRPLAQKIAIVTTFPASGKYQLSLFCKEAGVADSDHEMGCRYLVHATNKTVTVEPALADPVTIQTSPRRHKPTTSFRATSLKRVDSAASLAGKNVKRKVVGVKAEIDDLHLDTSMKVDKQFMKRLGIAPLSHLEQIVIHQSNEPLTITLRTPPRVECEAVLRFDKGSNTESSDADVTSWEPITGFIQVWPRPMAQKTKVVTKFPQPGKFELRIFAKTSSAAPGFSSTFENQDDTEPKLGWRYIVEVSKKTANTGAFEQTGQSPKKSKSPGGKSPGMHLSDRKKLGSSGRRETKMSLW